MARRIPSRLVLFLILLFCSTITAAAIELGLAADGGGLIAAAPGYQAKGQWQGGIRLDAMLPVGEVVDLGVALSLAAALPSDAAGWYVYRGYCGFVLELAARAAWPAAGWPGAGSLAAGFEASGGAALLTYSRTTLTFFSPLLRVAGILSFTPAAVPFLDLVLTMPVVAWLRPDLSAAVSLGLGIGIVFSAGRLAAHRAARGAPSIPEIAP